jgi:hypothetical protein
MSATDLSSSTTAPADDRSDRLLAPTRWVAMAVIPVLVAAFVILYGFPGKTQELWGWMVCPSMSALVMGGGYLAGAYLFTRVCRSTEWHRVGVGFAATTVFSSILMATTILHWSKFNHDHVSFWAWLLLYAVTPALLPVLWWNNRRTDPGRPAAVDTAVPRGLRIAVGTGGAIQLALAAVMFAWPRTANAIWPWPLEVSTSRSLSAFVAFPAVTWVWFWFDDRWSSFRITQQVATIGLISIAAGIPRAADELRDRWQTPAYVAFLLVAIAGNVALIVVMERRARASSWAASDDGAASMRAPAPVG